MNKKKGQQLMVYLFIGLSMITAILAYTIESWRWGGAAFGVGFLLIAALTYWSRKKPEEE
ncbi:MAG: hypothetical protein KDD06_06215 [Phaeodactylibacter sp.]|nr:hypothetical protein [Phaeodactylibacter sp.]